MADILEIKLKSRNGGSTIIDIADVESLYFGEVVEYISYKDNELRRCKKAGEAGLRLQESADKFCCGGKMSVFEKILNEHNIYSIELLYSDDVEEILVPYESDSAFSPNRCQKNVMDKGLKIAFKENLQ